MHTSLQLIDLAKQRLAEKHGRPLPMTDYRLAKLMELSQQVVAGWRSGSRTIGTKFARKFAEACDLDPAYVLACIEQERERDPTVRQIWTTIAEHFDGKAAAFAMMSIGAALLAAGMIHASPENLAAFPLLGWSELYIMRTQMRRIRSLSFEFCGPPDLPLQRRWAVVGNV